MTKLCPQCHETKPLDSFTRDARRKDGLDAYCKPCKRAWKRAWKRKNPDRIKQHYRAYYDGLSPKAKARCIAYGKAYRRQHRDRINALTRQWRRVRVPALRLQARQYYLLHRALLLARMRPYNAKRRARKAAALFVDDIDLDTLYKRDRGICSLCHQRVARVEASRDHIIPLSKGGEESSRNVVLAHFSCNASKKDRVVTQQLRLF